MFEVATFPTILIPALHRRNKDEDNFLLMRFGHGEFDWKERVSIDPGVCHGKPCIKGIRIMVSILLDYLKAGEDMHEILKQYPTLTEADIRAALAYAAWLAHEEEVQPLHTETTG